MDIQQRNHPSQRQLAAFALKRLAEPASNQLSSHLSQCSACREFIRSTSPEQLEALLTSGVAPTQLEDHSTPGGGARSTFMAPSELEAGGAGSANRPLEALVSSASQSDAQGQSSSEVEIPPALLRQTKYRIVRLLGRGGMGLVYEAYHAELMDRQVALKVISSALVDNAQAFERFNREVKAAARLDHPNVARAYDADEFEMVRVLVMEFVPGESLDQLLSQKGRLAPVEACRLVLQALSGLEHVHERGMVHRDLKPQNLMFTPDGKVKILDFGLAKVASERRPGPGLTRDHAMMGTPHYLAPEQARDAARADIRADIYSLGCTLYSLLSGHPPFHNDTEMNVLLAHQNEKPRPLAEVCPEVPKKLSDLVDRMLAKDPAQRPQTPRAAAQELLPFAKGDGRASGTRIALSMTVLGNATGHSVERASAEALPDKQRHGRFGMAGIAIALFALGFAAWALGLFSVKTPEGTIVIENLPADVDVQVDGATVRLTRKGDAVSITAVGQGDHHLKFLRDGKETWTSDARLSLAGQEVRVKYAPADRDASSQVGRDDKPMPSRAADVPAALVTPTNLTALPAGSQAIPVINPSFEASPVPDGGWTGVPIAGWSATGKYESAGVQNFTNDAYPGSNDLAPDADNSTALNSIPDGRNAIYSRGGSIAQVLTTPLEADTRYLLAVNVGQRADASMFAKWYRVQLLAGDELLAEDDNAQQPGRGQWLTSTVAFASGVQHPQMGRPLEIRILTAEDETGGGGQQGNYDNVRLVKLPAAAPTEPATIVLRWESSPTSAQFVIERAASATGPFEAIATISGDKREYQDAAGSLTGGITYYYRLRSKAGDATSAFSAIASVTTFPVATKMAGQP